MEYKKFRSIMMYYGFEHGIKNLFYNKELMFIYKGGVIELHGHIPLVIANKIYKLNHPDIKIKGNIKDFPPLKYYQSKIIKKLETLKYKDYEEKRIVESVTKIYNKNPQSIYIEEYEIYTEEALAMFLKTYYEYIILNDANVNSKTLRLI